MDNRTEYRIIKTEIPQFAIFEDQLPDSSKNFNIQSSISFNYNHYCRLVKCTCGITFYNGGQPLIKAANSLYFELSEATEHRFISDESIQIPRNVLIHFATLTYGALRGIIIAKTENMAYSIPVIPTVDLTLIITDPYVQSLRLTEGE